MGARRFGRSSAWRPNPVNGMPADSTKAPQGLSDGPTTSAAAEAASCCQPGNSIPWIASLLRKPVIGWALAAALLALIIFIGLRRSGRWERGVMAEQLRDEVGTPSVTPEEYTQIEGCCEPPRKDKTAREIFVTQCNLAKRKFRLHLHDRPVDDDPVVQAWRQDLQQLRQPMLA